MDLASQNNYESNINVTESRVKTIYHVLIRNLFTNYTGVVGVVVPQSHCPACILMFTRPYRVYLGAPSFILYDFEC